MERLDSKRNKIGPNKFHQNRILKIHPKSYPFSFHRTNEFRTGEPLESQRFEILNLKFRYYPF